MPSSTHTSNPFESPPHIAIDVPATTVVRRRQTTLDLAATALITCGVVYLVCVVVVLPISVWMYRTVTAETEEFVHPSYYLDQALSALLYGLAFSVVASVLVYSGWSIRRRKHYWTAIIGAAIGCLPLPLVMFSIVPSVWLLWKLSRADVRSQFAP